MSRAIYRLLLRLYPLEVRTRWEGDMVDLFELQLAESWLDAWTCALSEIFQVALPLFAAREIVVISLVSSSVSAIILFGLIWALGNSMQLLNISHQLLAKLG